MHFNRFPRSQAKHFVSSLPPTRCSCRSRQHPLSRSAAADASDSRSSTGVLHFHSHNANIVVKRFAFGKLANVADDAVKKFLGRKASVASDGSVQLVLREECAGSIFHFE